MFLSGVCLLLQIWWWAVWGCRPGCPGATSFTRPGWQMSLARCGDACDVVIIMMLGRLHFHRTDQTTILLKAQLGTVEAQLL